MKKRINLLMRIAALLILLLCIVYACKDEDEPEVDPVQLPQLSTLSITDITSQAAMSGGNVTDDGGAEVTARGLVWSSNELPTLTDNEGISTEGGGTGEFSSQISGLAAYSSYFVRAYATNSSGTAYGNQLEFETLPEGAYATVTDIDGNKYWTLAIGDEEWMAVNLRTTKYTDGTSIPTGLSIEEWTNTTEGAYTVYPYEDTLGGDKFIEPVLELDNYGLIYNAEAARSGKLCPDGWYVPSYDQWENTLAAVASIYNVSEDEVGDILKSCRQVNSPLGGGCKTDWHPRWNESEFAYGKNKAFFLALPAGELNPEVGYLRLGESVTWWTTTPLSDSFTKRIGLTVDESAVFGGASRNNYGYSVRCYRPLVKEK
jgi:uncharacterized protein (TIGR02145 family)